MDESYDVVVLGTGLKECILSGLLSVAGMKVLHMDRNNYYGGESASLNLNQLYEKLRPGQTPPATLGPSRDYNIDMVPKFMMANGLLVRTLVYTDVTKYLEFKAVDGSYVYVKESAGSFGGLFGKGGASVNKVPATDMEALASPLLTLFEKNRARGFFKYVQDYDEADPKTHKGLNLGTMTMKELFSKHGLEASTIDFVGHALALHRDDGYLVQPAILTVRQIKLYHDSLTRFENMKAPYIYPLYGLGELPQAFARLSAVYGGTYMLSRPGAAVVYDDAGAAVGVSCEGETAKCKFVVGDPSYFPGKSRVLSRVVRAVCIMSHPIPNTGDSHSVQIILPQKQLGRQSDVYVFCCSFAHNVAPKGKYLAFVSTTVETQNPEAELALGLSLLGAVDEKFVTVSEIVAPTNDSSKDKCFISSGYDATTHFQTVMEDVLALYTKITGKTLDLDKPPSAAAAAGGGGGSA